MTRGDQWAAKYGMHVVTGIVALVGAIATLQAQMQTKADKADIETLRSQMTRIEASIQVAATEVKAARTEVEQLRSYLCQSHRRDIGCQP